MNRDFPIYTVKNQCQDCYKCVRHCPCKAIRVKDGNASVIPELCVACGVCYQVCPAGAKRIRDDLPRAMHLLSGERKAYASVAPSWENRFPGASAGKLVAALKLLGFAGVGETAAGAQQVSAKTAEMLRNAKGGIHISSACPSVVEFIKRHMPEHIGSITPVVSPLLAHCKLIKAKRGDDCAVVFFGPCISKKVEADAHPELLDIALTFDDLQLWMESRGLKFDELEDDALGFDAGSAEEGRLYPMEGGMIDTLKDPSSGDSIYVSLSGLKNIERTLRGQTKLDSGAKVFIECLSCRNGCINGPIMHKCGMTLNELVHIAAKRLVHTKSSAGRKVENEIGGQPEAVRIPSSEPGEAEIKASLQRIGKNGKSDELNCGGCGYQTCRDFVKAMIAGKGEPDMCVSYLKRLSQQKANALIRYIPAGVVIADNNLKIIECNKRFAEMFGESSALAFEAQPGLKGVELSSIVNFAELFEQAAGSGGDVERKNVLHGDMILDIDIFTIETGRVLGAIVQDVTQVELRREQIAEKARSVIKKNILTVQRIANCLGEHMAETEIILKEVASGYNRDGAKPKKPRKKPEEA